MLKDKFAKKSLDPGTVIVVITIILIILYLKSKGVL